MNVTLLILGAAAAGAATGILMRWGNDLALAPLRHPEDLPHLPGAGLPARVGRGWALPSVHTPEGRLLDHMLQHPDDFTREDLLRQLDALYPAIRAETARILGRRLAGSRDAGVLDALAPRIALEKDPMARSAMKSARDQVAGP